MQLTRDLFAIAKFLFCLLIRSGARREFVNFQRPEWGEFVQLDKVDFQRLGKHAVFQLPSGTCTPDASSIGVEWSGNVTAAGSTGRGYGLGSAVGVLRGIMTSSSREKS